MPASGAAAPGGWGAHTGQGQMQVPGGPGYNSYSSSQQGGGPSRGHSRAPSEGPWDAVSNIGDGGNSHLPGGGGVGGAMAQAGYDAARAPRVSGPAASGPPSVTSPGLPSLPAAPSQKRTGQGQQGAQGQQQQQQQALGVSGQAGQQDAPKSQGRSGWRLLGLFAGGESSKQVGGELCAGMGWRAAACRVLFLVHGFDVHEQHGRDAWHATHAVGNAAHCIPGAAGCDRYILLCIQHALLHPPCFSQHHEHI